VARQWDLPRAVRRLPPAFDLYHVVDHSYGHLASHLPEGQTIVSCHDVDAFRSLAHPPSERRSAAFRWMSRRILAGLRRAARVACASAVTRDALQSHGGFDERRLSIVAHGVDATMGIHNPAADRDAATLMGPGTGAEILHVGSTAPRKRIDVLLDVAGRVLAARPAARLVRVGGPLSSEERGRARDLGITDRIVELPFLDRATLGAIYRRAALVLLPSEREGFGLPIVEAMACGTPVVASDIPVLREVAGVDATFCRVGDAAEWTCAVLALLDERDHSPARWAQRVSAGRTRAAAFGWSAAAASFVALYQGVAARPARAAAALQT